MSAALAALVAQTAPPPLHGRVRGLFVVLIIIAAMSFVTLLFTGPRALWVTWCSRKAAAPSPLDYPPEPDPGDRKDESRIGKRLPAVSAPQADRESTEDTPRGLKRQSISAGGDISGIISTGDGTINIQQK